MWWAAALPVQPLKPWPANPATTTTTTKPPPRRHSMVVYNSQIRQQTGGLNSNEARHPNAVKSNPNTKPAPPSKKKELVEEQQPQQEQRRQLSGSDILVALQRATAKKIKERRDAAAAAPALSNKSRVDDNAATQNHGNSRPLCIKPEWRDRLQGLERRLHELAHRHG